MKYLVSILALLAFYSFRYSHTKQLIGLQEALNKKWISLKATSIGGYQGETVFIEVKNLTGKELNLEIEPGMRLKAGEDKYQDLLVVKSEELIVNAGQTSTKKIHAYCCESSDLSPKSNLIYKPGTNTEPGLTEIAKYISNNFGELNKSAVQQAIWAISNKHPSAAISVVGEKEMTLKKLVCSIKNEPIPWYMIKQKIYQLPNGIIQTCNDSLLGSFSYNNTAWRYTYLNIYNEKDKAVYMSIGSWLPPGNNINYAVNLPIKNLPPGKYYLRLENEFEILSNKPVEI